MSYKFEKKYFDKDQKPHEWSRFWDERLSVLNKFGQLPKTTLFFWALFQVGGDIIADNAISGVPS